MMERMGDLAMRRIVILWALLCCTLGLAPASGEEVWEGTAALIRPGDMASPGWFAASNSFPRDAWLEVENLSNGKKTRVTVVQRNDESATVFILLSPEAAAALDISRADIARVRVRLLAEPLASTARLPADQIYSPDPDINPLAGLPAAPPAPTPLAPEPPAVAEPASPPPPAETPQDEPAPEAAPPAAGPPVEAQPPDLPPAPPQPAPQKAELVTPFPEVPQRREEVTGSLLLPGETASADLDRVLERRAARSPQKKLFLPPRDDERFALQGAAEEPAPADRLSEEIGLVKPEPVQVPEASGVSPPALPPLEEAGGPETPAVSAEPPRAGTETAAAAEPSAATPPEVTVAVPSQADGTSEAPAALPEPPDGPPPPEPAAESAVAATAAPPPAQEVVVPSLPVVDRLPPKTYYLQVGAYNSLGLARSKAQELAASHAVTVLSFPSRDRTVYRVMVGPLNRDESGVLLTWLKSRGYKDAFLRYSE
jgi:hypothetical protein